MSNSDIDIGVMTLLVGPTILIICCVIGLRACFRCATQGQEQDDIDTTGGKTLPEEHAVESDVEAVIENQSGILT